MSKYTDFEKWYIKRKIPRIKWLEISKSLRDFWVNHFNRLSIEEQEKIREKFKR